MYHFIFEKNLKMFKLKRFLKLGGSHNSIMPFQFGISHLSDEKDRKISKMILDFWTSFASKGYNKKFIL